MVMPVKNRCNAGLNAQGQWAGRPAVSGVNVQLNHTETKRRTWGPPTGLN